MVPPPGKQNATSKAGPVVVTGLEVSVDTVAAMDAEE
jgi:hypothetical protein